MNVDDELEYQELKRQTGRLRKREVRMDMAVELFSYCLFLTGIVALGWIFYKLLT